jgi:hypothetical protein
MTDDPLSRASSRTVASGIASAVAALVSPPTAATSIPMTTPLRVRATNPNNNNGIGGIGPPSLWAPSQLPPTSSSTPRTLYGHYHQSTVASHAPNSARSYRDRRPPSSLDGDIRPTTASSVISSSHHDGQLRYATPLPPDSPMIPPSSALSSLLLPSPSTPGSSLATLTELTNERMKRFQALYERHSHHTRGATDVALSEKLLVWNERKNDEKKSFESTIGKITRITQHRGMWYLTYSCLLWCGADVARLIG